MRASARECSGKVGAFVAALGLAREGVSGREFELEVGSSNGGNGLEKKGVNRGYLKAKDSGSWSRNWG